MATFHYTRRQRYGHVDVARLLLDRGSDVNVRETRSLDSPASMRHDMDTLTLRGY